MMKGNKIVVIIIAACLLIFAGVVITASVLIGKYNKYDMKMGEAPDLYIVYAVDANLSGSSVKDDASRQDAANLFGIPGEEKVIGIFSLVFPDDSAADVHFSPQNIAGLALSKEAFDAYDNSGGSVKKAYLPAFKAAILNAKVLAMLRNSAKQSEGNKNNAYYKFEEFKKENGVAANAAIRIAYPDLSCIDYVPADISYEEIGEIFGLVKAEEAQALNVD
jgi:hypothetical protein